MRRLLLDSDTLSALMRGQPRVIELARTYIREVGALEISLMSQFEVLRGLEAKGASKQIDAFESFCTDCVILPINEAVIRRAAGLYAELKRRGELIPDADLLIGATALVHGAGIVTGNVRHFARIEGLTVENWID